MKKFFVQLVLLCVFSIALQAQSKVGKLGLQVEAGYAFDLFVNDLPDYHHHAFNIAVSPGYYVTEKFFAGAGVALYDYRYTFTNTAGNSGDLKINSSFIAIPVYAHGMWKFATGLDSGFFFSLKAGYGFISKSMNPMIGNPGSYKVIRDYSGGLYLSPSLGFMYPINNIHALSLSVSYDHQRYIVESNVNGNVKKDNKNNSTVALKVGWMF